jgi:hypothetical protein
MKADDMVLIGNESSENIGRMEGYQTFYRGKARYWKGVKCKGGKSIANILVLNPRHRLPIPRYDAHSVSYH